MPPLWIWTDSSAVMGAVSQSVRTRSSIISRYGSWDRTRNTPCISARVVCSLQLGEGKSNLLFISSFEKVPWP